MKRVWIIPARDFLPLYIINSSPLPAATQGVFYSTQMQANGGVAPYIWSLPATNGFTINVASGLISGTPIAAETDVLSVTVTDSLGAIVTRPFSVTVNAVSSPLVITTTSPLTSAGQGVAYSFTMGATGGTPPYTWSFFTAPTGTNSWAISSAGVITGTPANIESDVLSIRVMDAALAHTDGAFTLPVVAFVPDFYPGGVTVADPYATWNTWYVDPTFGADTGTHNAAGFIYASMGYAMQDVFYTTGLDSGKRRIIVRSSAAWNGGSATPYTYLASAGIAGAVSPKSGSVAAGNVPANNYVLQGDPATSVLPFISGGYDGTVGSTSRNFMDIAVAAAIVGFTTRKLQFQDFCATCIHVNSFTSAYLGLEWCTFKNFYYNGGDSSAGAWAHPFHQTSSNWTIQHCKFENFGLLKGNTFPSTTGWSNENCSCLETYGANNVTVTNCTFTNTVGAMHMKLANQVPNHTDNWNITNNIFTGCRRAIFQNGASDQSAMGSNNFTMTGNLINGIVQNSASNLNAMFAPGGAIYGPPLYPIPGSPGSNVVIANNTVGETAVSGSPNQGFSFMGAQTLGGTAPGMTVRDNVLLCNGNPRITMDPNDAYFGAQSATVFSYCDYNVYGPSSAVWEIEWNRTLFRASYRYTTFLNWTHAFSAPQGPSAPTPPPDFALIGDPDQHGRQLANLNDFPNRASGDYTIAPASPLLTASSTGGRVGYDPTNCGAGW